MRGVRAAHRLGCRLADPEPTDLAGRDELAHGSPGLLDRDGRVDAVLVVEIDVVDAEPSQRRVTRGVHVVGTAVHAHPAAVAASLVAELRRQHDLVPARRDGLTDQGLVRERPVHVGGVEERHPQIEGAMDGRDRLGVVAGAVGLAHPHAAQTEG